MAVAEENGMGAEAPASDNGSNIHKLGIPNRQFQQQQQPNRMLSMSKASQVALINRHGTVTGQPTTIVTRPPPFGHTAPPEPKRKPFLARHHCLVCTICIIVALILILGIAVLVLYLLYKPKAIGFKIASITAEKIATPTAVTGMGLSAVFLVLANVTNPNRFEFSYDKVYGNLTYKNEPLGRGVTAAGTVRKQSTQTVTITMYVDTSLANGRDLSLGILDNNVPTHLDTTVAGTVKFFFLPRNYKAHIQCEIIIHPKPNPQPYANLFDKTNYTCSIDV